MENHIIISLVAVILTATIACLLVAKIQSKHYFLCKHCGKKFQTKWVKLIFEVHATDEHKIECPYCKVKDFCKDLGKD